ncbi:MAG: 8-amino-7-oxononanoate synthase [candidate division Zixibacteria bacterium SM23_81]|nr:MAG: 8-amino-7-oxononanoate synthase [candidate division Zixibacteria bacterium SM23_81]
MDIFEKCWNYKPAKIARKKGYYPYFIPIDSGQGSEVTSKGKNLIMIGSNNYMGLVSHPKVIEASRAALEKYGAGCTGSRFLNGTLDIHEKLEQELADFTNKEAALVMSTGFQTNLATISCLVAKGDVVITDRADHASIVDGCRLGFGKIVKYRHNDMNDLERVLKNIGDGPGKFIVTDGVFSMEGDIVDLPRVVELKNKYNARLMVDDAHSIGVLGPQGNGTAAHFGLDDEVDIIMGTFSKSFVSIGGFIAADFDVIDFVKHHGRALIFSASMPPASVAAVRAALKIIKAEPERRERLRKNANKMREGFQAMGYNTGTSNTPIIPVLIGEDIKTFYFWKTLFQNGIFTNPVVTPAVPPGQALIRTSYMATHTDQELDQVLEIFQRVGKELEIIP